MEFRYLLLPPDLPESGSSSRRLLTLGFSLNLCYFSQQGLMLLLQNLPTMHWGNEEVSVLLAEAYRLKFAFADAPNHYKR